MSLWLIDGSDGTSATALCLAMNSANDASVITSHVYESRARRPVWAARRLGQSRLGSAPGSIFQKVLVTRVTVPLSLDDSKTNNFPTTNRLYVTELGWAFVRACDLPKRN
jgi:hypothetical protein